MILNWNDYECYRETSLKYHIDKKDPNTYRNALNYLEHMRKYFGKVGFPDPNPRTKPTKSFPNGKVRKYTVKEGKQQLDDIREWIGKNK